MSIISHGWICLDTCSCCHTEIEASDQTCCVTESLYTVRAKHRLVGLVDKECASRAEDQGFESAWDGLKDRDIHVLDW